MRILSDPWWQGPCFGSQWWIYPPAHLSPVEAGPIDYIYISHGHVDHFHRGTLRRFPKETKVLVSSEASLAASLRNMDFKVIEVRPDEEWDLGSGVRGRIIPTDGGDTLLGITDGRETCLNLNDSLHAAPTEVVDAIIPRLRSFYPTIDYVFCGYGIASHFPNCYFIPGKDPQQTAIRRQQYFNRRWADVVHRLQPKFGFPFAADVVFLDDELIWANEPVHNAERPTRVFQELYRDSSTRVVDIAPGFQICDGEIKADVRFDPVSNTGVLAHYGEAKARKEAAIGREQMDVDLLVHRLGENIRTNLDYLREFQGDYRFLIVARGQNDAIEMWKAGRDIGTRKVPLADTRKADYDLVMTSYYSYLRRCFTTEFGNETLFVGSGCIFEYRDAVRIGENLHRELAVLLDRCTTPRKSRFGDQPRWLYQLKQFGKRLLGRQSSDLYDLQAWTTFASR